MTDERWVEVPGGRLWARADGDGDGLPVLLLHAGIVDSRAWDPLVPLLVDAGHRVIRYDARGFGRSTTEDIAYSNRADAIAVLDAFGVERGTLVGNSRGATIALDTACEFPDRVAAVVLLGGNIGGYEPEPTPEEMAAFERMEALEEDPGTPADVMADFDMALWVDGLGQSEERLPANLRGWIREQVLATYVSERERGQPIPLDPPAVTRLPGLTMPILAVHGALDVSDIEATGRYLAETCPNARFEIIPDVAHLIAVEAPERVAALVVETIRRAGGQSSSG
jgi:3-oxoadipate enol-lactonase